MSDEKDITYEKQESELKLGGIESSAAAINEPQQAEQENFYYDEFDRKCTLKKTGSKIILHRKRTKYKGKKLFDISIVLLGIIGILLFVFYIIILARHGWSKSNLYDIDSGNRITLILVAVFIIFISIIGILGSYTYWKPIILMTSLLTVLAFVSHFYLAKKFMDITRFADRDMALQWWDTYTDENIMAIQQEYNCCGYLNYKDRGFVTPNCPSELVKYVVPQEVHNVASVKKNDSYQRKFGTPDNPKNVDDTSTFDGATTATVDETTSNTTTDGNTQNTDTTTQNTDDTAAQNTDDTAAQNTDAAAAQNTDAAAAQNTNNNEDYDDDDDEDEGVWRKRGLDLEVMTNKEQDEEAKKLKQEIDLGVGRISRVGKGAIALPIKKRGITIEETMDDKTMEQLGEDIKNSLSHGQGKIIKGEIKQKKRYEPVFSKNRKRSISREEKSSSSLFQRDETISADNIVGCKDAIVDKVKSGVTPLYITLFILLIVYVLLFFSSVIYWWDLRNEKEYDEFS